MTVGSIETSGLPTVQSTLVKTPPGSTTVFGTYPIGNYFKKVWTGADYPVTKPQYEKIYWRDPYLGKLHVYKRRLDKPVRTKIDYHNYTCSITSNSDGWGQYTYTEFGGSYTEVRVLTTTEYGAGYSSLASSEWTSNDTIALQGKLREAVAGSDFNMAVFLGESHQALQLISNSATRIFKGLKLVKRGNIVGAAYALGGGKAVKRLSPRAIASKTPAQAWIELQYGWLPLLGDAHGAAQFLAKQLEFPLVKTYVVRKKKNLKLTATGGTLRASAHGETRAQIIARLSEASVAQLSGLLDPASVAWELLPWSFAIDWFIPIGSYLAARSLASSLTGEFVTTISRKASGTFTIPLTSPGIPPNYVYRTDKLSTATRSQVDVTRTCSTTLVVPTPNFKTLDSALSWRHCANAIALLTNLTGNHPWVNSMESPFVRRVNGRRFLK